jgi:hypothetical protein
MNRQPAQTSASIDLDVGLADIAAMNVEQLRELWRQKRGQEPPANSTPADPSQGDASPIDDGGRVRTWFAGSAKEQPVAR